MVGLFCVTVVLFFIFVKDPYVKACGSISQHLWSLELRDILILSNT